MAKLMSRRKRRLQEREAAAGTMGGGTPRFRGYVAKPSREGGFAIVNRSTMEQVSGRAFTLPAMSPIIHVNENQALGDPIPGNAWIEFSVVKGGDSKSGIILFDAKFIDPPQELAEDEPDDGP